MRVLGNYCCFGEVCIYICVGVVGFFNVGKSSLINSLKCSCVCSVGVVFGIIKFMQEVYLDKFIWFLDVLGIVLGFNLEVGIILCNCVYVQKLVDFVILVEIILQCCNLEEIFNYYGVFGFQIIEYFLMVVVYCLGKKKKGGLYSQEQVVKVVLVDWVSGKISFYILLLVIYILFIYFSVEIVKEMIEVFDIEDIEQVNEDIMECLVIGEFDELLGDMDLFEMEIKLFYFLMMKIVDVIENKIIVYKIGDFIGYCINLNCYQMGWVKCNVDYCFKSNSMVDVCLVDCCLVLQRIMEMDFL